MGVCPYFSKPCRSAVSAARSQKMVRRQAAHLEGRSKAARQAQRRNLGPLRNLTVQSKTRDRYNKALDKYKSYLQDEGRTFPRDAAGHDYLLSQYIEFLWETGEGRALACDTIASVQDQQPAIRGHLPICCGPGRPMKYQTKLPHFQWRLPTCLLATRSSPATASLDFHCSLLFMGSCVPGSF